MKKFFLLLFITQLVSCVSSKQNNITNNDKAYNIILIVADDLGRNDIGCYGNNFIETPNIDAIAADGIQFINAYAAAPLCSPTRASIISGNNPARINLTEHLHRYKPPLPSQKISPPRIVNGLPPQLNTIPKVLKQAGYVTAHFGKWHLGTGESSPVASGFDYAYGGGEEGLPKTFFYPFFNGKPYKDLIADTKDGDYLDDALTNKALHFLEQNNKQKFFIELNFYAPHVPIEGKPSLVNKYVKKRKEKNYVGLPENEYAAMVENIDYNVGKVITYLKQSGLDKNTLVIFTSDNGGLSVEEVPAFAKHTPPTTNTPLKGGKGYIYEGGIKAPWIVWAPSLIKKAKKEKSIISTDDIFNTTMELANLSSRSADGISFLPILKNISTKPRDYYLHFPHYSPQRGLPGAVIRRGNYKLIQWYEDSKIELYNLENDEGENNNIANINKAKVKELLMALEKWRNNVGAIMPTNNPNYKSN
jgi:arylsulfatase A-like enzyme